MKSLIRFGLQRAVLMNLIFVGVVVFAAAVALPRLPIEVFPNMAFGEVMVFVDYPGAPPEDVERLVAEPIEDTVRGMDDIDFVRCDSHAGHCSVHVKFVDDTDYAALYDDLRIRVLGAQNRLPVVNGEHLTPQIIKVEVDAWLPVIQLNLLPDDERLDKRSLILLARELRNRIELIDGVKGSLMVGERPQQFELALDPRRLERHGVTFAAATAALRRDGTAVPAGILESVAGERHVRVDDRYRTRADLLAVVVRRDGDGNLITIGDLVVPQRSGVRDVPGKVKVSVNGRPAIGIQVHKHADTGAREVVAALREQVALFERAHADEGVSVVATMDSTIKIADSMQALGSSLHLALVWVMVALFLFLTRAPPRILLIGLAFGIGTSISGAVGTFALIDGLLLAGLALFIFAFCRAAVLTATGIVFSFLGTLAYLHITGMSINEVSLLGFVLTCGIIVDDAIVVLENIRRHREHGKPLHRSALDGAAEVFWPVVSATLTTCCAFLPLLLMTGVIGQFFAIIPITVAIALVVSLFECLLLLPLHAVELERLLGPERLPPPRAENTAAFLERPGPIGVLARVYDRLLRWNLAHRAAAVGIALLLFAAAVGVLMQSVYGPRIDPDTRPLLKMEFFPDNTAPSGTTLDQTDALVREICGQIMQRPRSEVATCTGMAGMVWDESYKERYSHQHGFIFVELPPRAQQRYDDALAFVAELRDDLQRRFAHGGIRIEVRPQRDGPPTGAKVNVRVTGLSDAAVEGLAMELYAWMRSEQDGALAGIADIEHDRDLYHDELAFHVDPAAAARFDLPPSQVREFVAGAFDGLWVGDYLRTDDEIPVRLRIDPEALRQPIAI
ncbi:MAG: efflux RND transporter permease subunit, partial [Planctomycetota bacterium]